MWHVESNSRIPANCCHVITLSQKEVGCLIDNKIRHILDTFMLEVQKYFFVSATIVEKYQNVDDFFCTFVYF